MGGGHGGQRNEKRLAHGEAQAGRDGIVPAVENAAALSSQRLAARQGLLAEIDRDAHQLTLEYFGAEKDLERIESERPRWLDRLELARFESSSC